MRLSLALLAALAAAATNSASAFTVSPSFAQRPRASSALYSSTEEQSAAPSVPIVITGNNVEVT
eukprot:CAMPEP_0197432962 /NCGR_PEP_ID=MMETSP1175-20131217/923_1 /TAXON_ID=1003142 /ORGANISM="Triceratium dubium, Strain CCMP147" /LENGTH=63 /DNA_ID=CAMNT_0042961185 /DNA_START=38 /DNA_END=226 /DNA_ORIENTATION=+